MAADSKTEKATPKKRRDERKEGNVFKSTDVVNVVFIFGAFMAIQTIFPFIYDEITSFAKRFISLAAETTTVTNSDILSLSLEFITSAAISIFPFAAICMALGILLHSIQTKFLFASKSLRPKLNRLNPIEGVKKLFALKNVVELIKNLIKTVILIAVVYFLLVEYVVDVTRTMDMDIATSVRFTFEMVMDMIIQITMIFAVIAFFDYLYQRWDYERRIRMSKEDIKEEHKQTEGNPQIKGKIKETQRQMARMRMMQAVPNADVIIKNPTHFAVALSYNKEKHMAPIVVAKGQDELAFRIIAVGEENEVPVIENKPLARGIYAQAEVNDEIPAEFYGAVAEVLVYVYKLNNKLR